MSVSRYMAAAVQAVFPLAVATLLVSGCSLKDDPNEELPMSGNHSPGDLAMVTTDTSQSAYQYLEPAMSPSGTQIAFTADWPALPPPGSYIGDTPTIRSLITIAYQEGATPTQPLEKLALSGAKYVPLQEPTAVVVGDQLWQMEPLRRAQKGSPAWLDEQTLLFWMSTQRGDRLFTADLTQTSIVPQIVYYEAEDLLITGQLWYHRDPALSPDRQWVAFTRYGGSRVLPDSLINYTLQSIWVARLNSPTRQAFQISRGAIMMGGLDWSPDGRKIAFHSTLDIQGGGAFYGTELFTIDFDTTGLAQTGGVELNHGLKRLTTSVLVDGTRIPFGNTSPAWSADGGTIIFVSTRRAPTITLYDRSIWRIPSDGSLEPEIAFFSREDDIDAQFVPGSNNQFVLASAMGFPTEMLDRLEAEAIERITLEYPEFDETQVAALAAAERRQLEFFQRVMTHIFVFRSQ